MSNKDKNEKISFIINTDNKEVMGVKRRIEIWIEYLKIKKNKLLNFLFHKPLYTPAQKELFDKLVVGDVIYARMPFSDRTMAAIGKGHQNRPYLVVSTKGETVCAYPCSHKKRVSASYSYELKKEAYPFYHAYGNRKNHGMIRGFH